MCKSCVTDLLTSRLPADIKFKQYWTLIHWVGSGMQTSQTPDRLQSLESGWSACMLEPCRIKIVQSSEFRPAQIKTWMHFTNMWYSQSFCCLETSSVLKNKTTRDRFFSPLVIITRLEDEYFPLFPLKSCNSCILFPIGNFNVELLKHSTYGGRVGSDFCWQSQVGSTFRRVGSKKSDLLTTLGNSECGWDGLGILNEDDWVLAWRKNGSGGVKCRDRGSKTGVEYEEGYGIAWYGAWPQFENLTCKGVL